MTGPRAEARLREIVDIPRVPAVGDPGLAVVRVPEPADVPDVACEVLVVGGGTGGVAAALAAARRGYDVCLVEETRWPGGQLTSQGVSALDEHDLIERFGGTASWYGLREAIRDHYARLGLDRTRGGNPGSCRVTYRAAAYAASKGGVAQLTKALANEWAPHGVNVNAIAPGYVETDLNSHIWRDLPPSCASDYVHGIVLPVDGGWLAR